MMSLQSMIAGLAVTGGMSFGAAGGGAMAMQISHVEIAAGPNVLTVADRHRDRHPRIRRPYAVVPPTEAYAVGSYPGHPHGRDVYGYDRNDPQRPFGGWTAITAPRGTAAYAEQMNNRRYYCREAPERCP